VRDIPFIGNDMKDDAPTMDKPLDATDAPGRADSEMIEEANRYREPAHVNSLLAQGLGCR
jgi:hypothetical protein